MIFSIKDFIPQPPISRKTSQIEHQNQFRKYVAGSMVTKTINVNENIELNILLHFHPEPSFGKTWMHPYKPISVQALQDRSYIY